jgi:DNA polymerase III gamma/tau subunit
MLEQVAAFTGATDGSGAVVDAEAVEAAFGASGRSYARGIVAAVMANDAATSLRLIDDASEAGTDMQVLLRGIIAEYRNLLVARLNPELLERDLSAADAQAVAATAQATPQPKIVRGLRVFSDAFAAARTTNARLELETAILRLVVAGEDPSLDALAARVALLEGAAPKAVDANGRPAGVAPAAQATSSTDGPQGAGSGHPESADVMLQRVRSLWQSIRTRAEGERAPLRAPLSRATVESVESDVLTIRLVDSSMESYVKEHAAIIERAIADALGVPLRLRVRVERAQARSAHRAAPQATDPGGPQKDGDADLLDYAIKKIGRSERR